MIGSLLQADFEEIIAARDWDGLREALSELDSADIAELIIDVPPEVEGIVFRMLPREQAADVFEHLPINHRIQLQESSADFLAKPFAVSPPAYARSGESPKPEVLPSAVETWLIQPLSAPEFSLPDLRGSMQDLRSLRGGAVLLHF